jgi:hypothetical protein
MIRPSRTLTYRLDQPMNTCTFTLNDMDDGILIETLYGTALIPLSGRGEPFDFINAFRSFLKDANTYISETYPPSEHWGES